MPESRLQRTRDAYVLNTIRERGAEVREVLDAMERERQQAEKDFYGDQWSEEQRNARDQSLWGV